MSTIDLDAFEAFVEAMDDALSASGHDIGKVLRHLDNNGFEIKRKPNLVVNPEPEIDPITRQVLWPVGDPSLAIPSPQWPPRALGTKLWATNMDPEREKIYPVFSLAELKRVTETGANLIEASSEKDARSFWEARSPHDESSFTVDGTNYKYIMDQIPF